MIEASVVIPTYNRAESLKRCLEALANQTQPAADFEVVVVVDGSTDATPAMLNAFQSQFPLQLRVIHQPNSGQSIALNHGARAARGRVLIFLDDDIIAAPQLVSEHLKLHREGKKAVGIGKISLSLPSNADWYTRVFANEWENHYSILEQNQTSPTVQDCFGGNMSVLRAAYLAVDGNAEDLERAYDLDLAYRLQCSCCSLTYLPQAIGDQQQIKGFRELVTDSTRSGRACLELSRRHPALLPLLLGSFGEQRPSMATKLRLLLALNPTPDLLMSFVEVAGKWIQTENNYHLLQRYAFWREVRRGLPDGKTWQALIQGIPVLAYHAFGGPGDLPSRFILPIQRFGQQMAWLKWNGYRVLSLPDYLNCLLTYRLPPPRSVILTIDDGYADTYSLAYPVLRRYDYGATVFLVNQGIGGTNTWDSGSELSGRPMLSRHQILEMYQGKIDYGAHTCTHPDLTKISAQQARQEIQGSRAALEQELGVKVSTFSYPYGNYNQDTLDLAGQAGFQGSVTMDIGKNTLATPLHRLRRVEIRGSDSLLQFALAVRYGIPWKDLRKQLLQ